MQKKGQSSLEVILVIILFVLAFLCMQHYLRRAIAGNWRSNADSFSDEQYDPSSLETVSLNFVNPSINVVLPQRTERVDVSRDRPNPIIRIDGWGRYE